MTDRTGHCLCGQVRFAARLATTEFGACHCEMCRRWTGSALLAITVADGDLTLEGVEHVRSYRSSDWAERGWCGTCGSHLWYRVTLEGPHKGEYEIPVGLLDDTAGLNMTREIFVDRKPEFFSFAGDHEQLTEAQVLALYGQTTEGA